MGILGIRVVVDVPSGSGSFSRLLVYFPRQDLKGSRVHICDDAALLASSICRDDSRDLRL